MRSPLVLNRRRALAAMAGLAALPLLAGCPGGTRPASEEEDCDADDLLEGDEDCDNDASRHKKKTKPKTTGNKGGVTDGRSRRTTTNRNSGGTTRRR